MEKERNSIEFFPVFCIESEWIWKCYFKLLLMSVELAVAVKYILIFWKTFYYYLLLNCSTQKKPLLVIEGSSLSNQALVNFLYLIKHKSLCKQKPFKWSLSKPSIFGCRQMPISRDFCLQFQSEVKAFYCWTSFLWKSHLAAQSFIIALRQQK